MVLIALVRRSFHLIAGLAMVAAASPLAAQARYAESSALADGTVKLQHCLITAVDDVQVASHRAGLITKFQVKEGDHVASGATAAQIDDSEAKLQVKESHANLHVGRTKAASPHETDYAVATHKTAEQEHKIATNVNQKQAGAVSALEVERLRLAAEQAFIKISVAEQEKQIRGLETEGLEAKAGLADVILEQHQIRAPIEGEVVERYLHEGEWVEAGKPVLRLVRLDKLRVEGFVKTRDLLPHEIMNRPVRIEVELARKQKITFEGKVTFVSPLVQPGGDYRVWAEVENRKDQGQWLLRPGLEAEMIIGK